MRQSLVCQWNRTWRDIHFESPQLIKCIQNQAWKVYSLPGEIAELICLEAE